MPLPLRIKVEFNKSCTDFGSKNNWEAAVLNEISYPLPAEFGTASFNLIHAHTGIGYGHFTCTGVLDKLIFKTRIPTDSFKITLHESEDESEVTIDGQAKTISLKKYQSHLFSPNAVGVQKLYPDRYINQSIFFIPPEVFLSTLDDLRSRSAERMLEILDNPYRSLEVFKSKASSAVLFALYQMRNCGLTGNLKGLYIEGKLLEIISLHLSMLLGEEGIEPGLEGMRISVADKKKIYESIEILALHFQNPPNISELARLVGLNTTKLKKYFKIEFGTTIFGYIRQMRMQRAVFLLQKTDKNVTEIAWEVGYSSPSAFSAAFKREVGYSPSHIGKRGA
jgi:AraC-like DNA-binding protein